METDQLLQKTARLGLYCILAVSAGCTAVTPDESTIEIVLEQDDGRPGRTGPVDLPWQMTIRTPGTWILELHPRPGAPIRRIEEKMHAETTRIIEELDALKVLEIPSGRYGINIPDYPLFVLTITTSQQSREYVVGSLSAVRDLNPEKSASAFRLLSACCKIVDSISLPPQALNRASEVRAEMERNRPR